MKKKWLFIVGLLLIIIVLSLSKKTDTTNEVIVDTEEVIYNDVVVVDSTSNLFSIIGLNLSLLIEKSFGLIFNIINKLLEFAFGI